MKTALTIAGSDSSGGAGIQADLKTFSVLGVYGMSAITCVTAQNTLGVMHMVEMSADIVRQQIDVTSGDIQPDGCKTGMLGSADLVEVVEECIKRNNLFPYVCDPVMVSKAGSELLKKDAVELMRKKLFPIATVVTPNLREVASITGTDVRALSSSAAGRDACRRFIDLGCKAVVVKGIVSGDQMVDVFFDGREFLEFADKLQPAEKTHGSGCAFSAAITAGLASGKNLVESIDQAKQLVTMAIQYGDGQGRGTTPVNVLAFAPKKK